MLGFIKISCNFIKLRRGVEDKNANFLKKKRNKTLFKNG